MMHKLLKAAIVGLGLLASVPASAATFNFDTANTGWQNSLSYSSDGIDLTVTGGTKQGVGAQVATWKGFGLGVCNNAESLLRCPTLLDQHAIDNFIVLDDYAVLTFSTAVKLTKLVFNGLGNKDNTFDLYMNDGSWTQLLDDAFIGGDKNAAYDLDTPYALAFAVAAGNSYVTQCFGPVGHKKCFQKQLFSAFKLRSLDVEALPAEVPLPAAGLLMAGALGGLAALRRRKAA